MATISVQFKKELESAFKLEELCEEFVRVTSDLFGVPPSSVMVLGDFYPPLAKNVPDILIRCETSMWRLDKLETWGNSLLQASRKVLEEHPNIIVAIKPFAVDSKWMKG